MIADCARLFNPKGIAVIGASDAEGKVGSLVFRRLIESERELYPVNPKRDSIYGYRVYRAIDELPANIDLAIVTISAEGALGAVGELVRKKVGFIIIIAGGFGEVGPEGREIEERIRRICRDSGTRVLGPNTLGIYLPEDRLDSVFVEHGDKVFEDGGGVACILQSGSVGIEAIGYAASMGYGLRAFVGLGNKLDLNELDFLDHFSRDEKTRCLAFYLESIDGGRAFLEAARTVSARKPVVILKGGRTRAGKIAVSAHTGRPVGEDDSARFKHYGIQSAADEEEYIDMSKTLAMLPPAPGNRVAVLTPAGGYGVIATDYIDDESAEVRLEMATLSENTRIRIKEATFPFASCSNPVDITASADDHMFAASIDALSDDENVDIIICIILFGPPGITPRLVDTVAERVKDTNKPILVFSTYGPNTSPILKSFYSKGVVGFPSVLRTVKAARYLVERGQILEGSRGKSGGF